MPTISLLVKCFLNIESFGLIIFLLSLLKKYIFISSSNFLYLLYPAKTNIATATADEVSNTLYKFHKKLYIEVLDSDNSPLLIAKLFLKK